MIHFKKYFVLISCVFAQVKCQVGSCGYKGSEKEMHFVSPDPEEHKTHCNFRINPNSSTVCQLRFDLQTFELAPPTGPDEINPSSHYFCQNDWMQVTVIGWLGEKIPDAGIDFLCGNNTGQHFYIPMNRTDEDNGAIIEMILDSRTESGNKLPNANWRIKVSQIECTQSNPGVKFADGTKDQDLLAPPGCLQYYRDTSGTYESFNYNNGNGPYLGDMLYSVCFKRINNICGMRHSPLSFNLSSNLYHNKDGTTGLLYGGTERDCDSNTNDLSWDEGHRFDYLSIPDAEVSSPGGNSTVTRATKFCATSLKPGDYVNTYYTGTLQVSFRSDGKSNKVFPDAGFKMKYQMMDTNHRYGVCDVVL